MKTYRKKLKIIKFRDGGFHFLVECKINGTKSFLIIDTGASMSLFDKNSELFTNVIFSKIEGEQYSFNSSDFEIMLGKIECFEIGRFKTVMDVAAFSSFDYINQIYKEQHVPRVVGLLGADFLLKNNVILDFYEKYILIKH